MGFLDGLPSGVAARTSRLLWATCLGGIGGGLFFWLVGLATGSIAAGVTALWLFALAAATAGLVLPLPLALVSALYAGLAGWLVDMLPLVILVGWTAAVARWAAGLLREKRMPRGGRWIWLPIFLVAWTALGVLVVEGVDLRHFLLLSGVQVVASGVMLAVVDSAKSLGDRARIVSGLVGFVVLCTVGVFLQYMGVPIQLLQNEEISERVEEAYGLDAFASDVGMINYGLSSRAGAGELRQELGRFADSHPRVPPRSVFLPRFRAFDNHLVVRFAGSARPVEEELRSLDIELIYDNIGLAPAGTVPRWRSFARNSLTYAGICVALLPFAFYVAWTAQGRKRLMGWAAVASCLLGAGFSLARGSWLAILIGVIYLALAGVMSRRRKVQVAIAFVAAVVAVTGTYIMRYGVDPLNARSLGKGSIDTRALLYEDTVESIRGVHILVGYGTESPRTESGATHVANRYIPPAGTHSTYLNYLFRTGLPGALAILGLYGISALHARAAARVQSRSERLLATLSAASVVSLAAHAAILSLFVEPIYTLTISLILGLAMAGAKELPTTVLPLRIGARDGSRS